MENIYMQNLASLGDNHFLADRRADLKKNKNKNLKSIYCKKKLRLDWKSNAKNYDLQKDLNFYYCEDRDVDFNSKIRLGYRDRCWTRSPSDVTFNLNLSLIQRQPSVWNEMKDSFSHRKNLSGLWSHTMHSSTMSLNCVWWR